MQAIANGQYRSSNVHYENVDTASRLHWGASRGMRHMYANQIPDWSGGNDEFQTTLVKLRETEYILQLLVVSGTPIPQRWMALPVLM
jgi:hypothetical protein